MNNKHYVGKRISAFELYDEIGPITGVALLLDDENELLAGDDSGYMIEVSCPYGTQAIADDILTKLKDKTYKGYHGENAILSPAAELGDGISVNGIYSMLAHRNVVFGPGHMAEISAPGDSDLENEYKWTDPKYRAFKRKLAQTQSMISKTSEEIRLEITAVDERVSTISQTVDSIELSVSSANGSTTFTLKAGEAELSTKTLNLSVDAVNVTGKLTASQIDATDLHVKAANIDGDITIDLGGVIKWEDLSEEVQDEINYAYSLADSAADDADSALTKVNAVTYKYGGKTYIDEDCIMAGTVIAGHLMGGTVELLDADEYTQGYITITDADTADYAIEIQSNGAMRLLADGNYAALYMEAGDAAYLAIQTVSSNGYHVISNRSIVPASNGSMYVGTSYRYWAGMYSETGVIETSDRNKKKDFEYGLDKLDGVFDDLKPSSYRFVNGTSGRRHSGFSAQDVRDNLKKHGISTQDFAGYVEGVGENGEITYGLRYSEFIALLVEQVQKLKARVAQLEVSHGKK